MSVKTAAIVSIGSAVTDLGLHVMNYGVPMPTSVEYLRSEEGLALSGTASGILATAITTGINSAELDSVVATLKSDYERKLVRVMIVSSTINVKMLTQTGVTLLHSILLGNTREQLMAWATKQFVPSLFIHGIIAGTLPYFMAD
jgi:hypothetical protein